MTIFWSETAITDLGAITQYMLTYSEAAAIRINLEIANRLHRWMDSQAKEGPSRS